MVKGKTIAMIPARIGSTRLRVKNLALLNGKPLIHYAIKAAKESRVFDQIVVNSDHEVFSKIAELHDVEFYLRPNKLGSSITKSDDVVYDFMKKHPGDILAWVNPICPFQTGREIKTIKNYFDEEELDTLMTVKTEQVHCIYEGRPVNFAGGRVFAQTQELEPVQPFVYSVMMWRNKAFIEAFNWRGCAVFCGKIGYYPVSKEAAIIIKTKEDLMMAEVFIRARESAGGYEVKYDKLIDKLGEG